MRTERLTLTRLGYQRRNMSILVSLSNKRIGCSADVRNKEDPLRGLRVLVVGAGGAGRALAFGAKDKGAEVLIANRTDGEST